MGIGPVRVTRDSLIFAACVVGFALGIALVWIWNHPHKTGGSRAQARGFSQATHVARGCGTESARVDSQLTLKISEKQADDVYKYLSGKYAGKDNLLSDLFPSVHLSGQSKSDVSLFTDEYYDTPDLALYKNQNSVRFRSRVNTTDAEDRKSGRQLVQMKVTPPGQFDSRTELKYEVKDNGRTDDGKKSRRAGSGRGRHKNFSSRDDRHPLIKMISRSKRRDFLSAFEGTGIDPYSLEHILTLQQTRSRVYINWDATNILSFSVDTGSARVLWAKESFASVDIGLVEIAYTEANDEKRKTMREIRDAMVKDLKDHFPALTVSSDSKYGIVLEGLIADLPLVPLLAQFDLL